MSWPPQPIPLTANIQNCFLDSNEWLIHQLPCGFSSVPIKGINTPYNVLSKEEGGQWETNFTNFLAPALTQPTWKWVPAKPKLIPTNVGHLDFQQVWKARTMWQTGKSFGTKIFWDKTVHRGKKYTKYLRLGLFFPNTETVQLPVLVRSGGTTYQPYWFGSVGAESWWWASWPNNGIMDQRPSEARLAGASSAGSSKSRRNQRFAAKSKSANLYFDFWLLFCI